MAKLSFLSDEAFDASAQSRARADAFIRTLKPLLPNKRRHHNKMGPMSVAIYGSWGCGKTTHMRSLQQALERGANPATTIWFEPWRYENEDNLLAPLLGEILGTVSAKLRQNDAVQKAAVETGKRLLGRLAKVALRSGAGLIARSTGVPLSELEAIGSDFAELYNGALSAPNQPVSESEAFRQDFDELVRMAGIAENGGSEDDQSRPVCIFIDDLDRCAPDQVVRMLEALKLSLWSDGVVFFLALDQTQVLTALMERQKRQDSAASSDQLRATAAHYLEKFFLYAIDLDDDTTSYQRDIIPAVRAALWQECETALKAPLRALDPEESVQTDLLNALKDRYALAPNNLRRIKRSLRWLYFEIHQAQTIPGLATRFTEFVFSERYPTLWLGLVGGQSIPVRVALYTALQDILTYGDSHRPDLVAHFNKDGSEPNIISLDPHILPSFNALKQTAAASLVSELINNQDQDEIEMLKELCGLLAQSLPRLDPDWSAWS